MEMYHSRKVRSEEDKIDSKDLRTRQNSVLNTRIASKMGKKGFCCFLWLGVTCGVVLCQVCPRAEDIAPCTCKQYPMPSTTTCANITDMDTLYDVFGKTFDFPIIQFVLVDSHVMYLPASSVADKKFHNIIIRNSALASLFDGQPGKTDLLVDFRIIDARLMRGVQWDFFSSFTNLSRLEFQNTEVKKLDLEFNKNIYKGIQHLSLINSKMTVLEDWVFVGLSKLEWLDVTLAKISFLKRSMFPNPSALRYLNFNGNLLTTLPNDIFDNMPLLETVELASNQFTTLSEDIFGKWYRRTEINLDLLNNPLVCDCKVRWYLPKLRFRSISGNCVDPPSMKDKSFNFMKSEYFSYCDVV